MCCNAASVSAAMGGWPPRPDSAAVKTMTQGGPARRLGGQDVEALQFGG
jgi:hypothetical protein